MKPSRPPRQRRPEGAVTVRQTSGRAQTNVRHSTVISRLLESSNARLPASYDPVPAPATIHGVAHERLANKYVSSETPSFLLCANAIW